MRRRRSLLATGLVLASTVFLTSGVAAAPAPSGSDATWSARYEAEEAEEILGAVHHSDDIADQPADLDAPLTGYSGEGFLDFADPVPATSWEGTLPAGTVGAKYEVDVPEGGSYRLRFVYNNPGTKWDGSRNARDERNMRININGSDYLDDDGWVGWMIFAVSGYNGSASGGDPQNASTVGQNAAWNSNYMNVPLQAGHNTLRMSIEAPPGQGVYDGPNLDYIEVEQIDEQYTPAADVPQKSGEFAHPGIYNTEEDLQALKSAASIPGSVWHEGYEQLASSETASFEYSRPGGYFETVERGPYNNPDRGSSEFIDDGTAIYHNALMWSLTGDARHAQKAIELLNGWSSTLKKIVNNDSKLLVGLAGRDYVAGAEIIKHLYNADPLVDQADRWSQPDMEKFDELVRNVFYEGTIAEYYPQANGNWDSLITSANMAFGVYLDDADIFDRALRQYYRGDVVDGTASMGALPNYIYPSGESQESNRDVGHWGMGLQGFGYTAEIALNQGLDVFGAYEDRLLQGANYYGAFNLSDTGMPVDSATFVSDKGRGTVSTPAFEILSNYYSNESSQQVDLSLVDRVLDEKLRSGDSWIDAMLFQDAPEDTERPVVELVSPSGAGPFAKLSVQVDANDDVGLNRIVANVYQDGALVRSTQSAVADGAVSGSHAAQVSLSDGDYSMKFNAHDLAGKVPRTGSVEFSIDSIPPRVSVKDGDRFTIGAGPFEKVSFKLFDAGKVDRVELNGTVKDLTDNKWSDVNFVVPGTFGAVRGDNALTVFDVAGNVSTVEFTLD